MPYNEGLAEQIRTKRTLSFNFSQMPEQATNDLLDTLRVTLRDPGPLVGALERGAKEGKSGTVDLSTYAKNLPGGVAPPGILGRALGDTAHLLGKAFTPFAPVEYAAKGLNRLGDTLSSAIMGPPPALPAAPPPTPDLSGLHPPPDPFSLAPASATTSAPMLESSSSVPQNAPTGAFERFALSAPFDLSAELLRGVGSPGGLVTLPLAEFSAPLARSAGMVGKVAPKIGGAMAERAAQMETVPSLFTMATRFAAEKTAPMTNRAKEAAINLVDARMPGVAAATRKTLAYVMRPASLRMTQSDLVRNTIQETSEQLDFTKKLVEELTPEQNKRLTTAFQTAQAEKIQTLERMKAAAEDVLPEDIAAQAAQGLPGTEGEELMASVAEQNARAAKFKKMTLARFASELPRDVHLVVIQQARLRGSALLSAEEREIYDEVQARFMDWADRQIAAKVAGPEAFAVQYGTYVPDFYLQHEIELGTRAFKGVSTSYGVRSQRLDLGRLKQRVITDPLEKMQAGLQASVPYAFAKGAMQETFDANVGEAFHAVALNPELALPVPKAPGWEALKGRKYGALDGMFVHPSVKLWIDGMSVVRGGLDTLLRRAASAWKSAVTAYNPPVHFGNIPANVMMWDFGGVDPIFDIGKIRRALKSYRSADATFDKIKATGLVGSSELRQRETEQLMNLAFRSFNELPDAQTGAVDLFHQVVTQGPKKFKGVTPSAIYNAEEEISKYVMAHVAFEHGIPLHGVPKGDLLGAVRHAEKWQFNTNDVSPLVREARLGPGGMGALFGTPFVTYQTKVIPRMVEAAFNSPLKFVKWHAMFQGLNRASMHALGMTDDDYRQYRQLRADVQEHGFMREFTKMAPLFILPMRDAQGYAWSIDLSRMTPYGQAFQPRGLPVLGLGPLAQGIIGSQSGIGAMGQRLFDPNAQDALGRDLTLHPSMAQRQVRAFVDPFVPPLARRAAVGALSAMGPKFDTKGPLNLPASLLEDIGSVGAVTPQGTVQGPMRQVMSALIASPEVVDLPFLKKMKGMRTMREERATRGQVESDAMKRERAIRAAKRK